MELRNYQKIAVEKAMTWFRYQSEPGIVSIATAGGKSIIMAAIADRLAAVGKRVCILANREELIKQNAGKLSLDHGIFSASIGQKDASNLITVASINSIYNKPVAKFDIILIDECQAIPNSDEGMYWDFIAMHRPCKIIGFTATPYRLKGGKLKWGKVIYEAGYKLLLDKGYVAPITNKVKDVPDLSSVKIRAGDYLDSELSSVMESPELIESAIRHMKVYGENRNSVLIFTVSLNHADLLAAAMEANGMECYTVSGHTSKEERRNILTDFKERKIKWLINCQVLLEGFDAPCTDMIVCLRPTKSKALHEQMLGRSVRLYDGKADAFILDMAGNLAEHGGLGTPYREPGKKESKVELGRVCPECEVFSEGANLKECPECGYEYIASEPHKVSHNYEADFESEAVHQTIRKYKVKKVRYCQHIKRSTGAKSIRIDYICDNTPYGAISEWVSPWNNSDWARNKAYKFYKDRGVRLAGDTKDMSAEDLLFKAAELRMPSHILVDHSDKFPNIISYEWEKADGSGYPAGISPMDQDILDGDEVPF